MESLPLEPGQFLQFRRGSVFFLSSSSFLPPHVAVTRRRVAIPNTHSLTYTHNGDRFERSTTTTITTTHRRQPRRICDGGLCPGEHTVTSRPLSTAPELTHVSSRTGPETYRAVSVIDVQLASVQSETRGDIDMFVCPASRTMPDTKRVPRWVRDVSGPVDSYPACGLRKRRQPPFSSSSLTKYRILDNVSVPRRLWPNRRRRALDGRDTIDSVGLGTQRPPHLWPPLPWDP